MKGYKKKIIITMVILSYILTAAACDFIVKETPVDITSEYQTVDTPEAADSSAGSDTTDSTDTTGSDTSSDKNTDTENESKTVSSKTSADTSSVQSKSASSGNTTSKAASSNAASSKAASSKTSSDSISSRSTSSKTTSSDTSSKTTSSNSEVKVTNITLDIYELTLDIGQSKMPIVTMSPSNAVNKKEIWKTSDENVATVDGNGIIRAVGEGKCVVTVTADADSKVDAKVSVTVKGKPKVESLDVSFTETTIAVGQTVMPRVTMLPLDADTLEEKWTSDNESIATVDRFGNITGHEKGTCKITVTSVSNDTLSKEITVTVKDGDDTDSDNGGYTDRYFDGTLIVNKTYGLSPSYNPGGLTPECSAAFERLRQGAAEDGIVIYIESGFRSYEEQVYLYNMYVSSRGKEAADTFSARPGHSEHQTGLTIDCNDASDYFAGTAEAEWLAEHSHEYGFIIRYPQGKESITGYKYEPWHIRYVGKDLAEELYTKGETLEEHFGIKSEYRD